MSQLFEQISVDMTTGAISYPEIPGFELDTERVYRSVARYAQYAPSMELAVKHAIHEQLSAYVGLVSVLRVLDGGKK